MVLPPLGQMGSLVSILPLKPGRHLRRIRRTKALPFHLQRRCGLRKYPWARITRYTPRYRVPSKTQPPTQGVGLTPRDVNASTENCVSGLKENVALLSLRPN